LAAAGFKVTTATGAEEALQLFESPQPQLILLDIQTAGIDGLELTRRLKADSRRSIITLVTLTSYAMKGDRVKTLEAAATAKFLNRSTWIGSSPQSQPCFLLPEPILHFTAVADSRHPLGYPGGQNFSLNGLTSNSCVQALRS
jgi:CheY-like chemotaxis protein